MKKPLILISNDDGIEAKGINDLAKELKKFAEVIAAAPHTQQSAVGHAITIARPIRATTIYRGKEFFGFAVEGTPADSVKLAIRNLLKGRKPDLVISGINHGSNTAINILYSGTVSAATEGTILGIPSIAISLASLTNDDFGPSAKFAARLAKYVIKNDSIPKGTLLNVNVPSLPAKDIKGVMITKQGKAIWDDVYERRLDPKKTEYFWLKGKLKSPDKSIELDQKAIDEGYISITPIHYDLTDYAAFEQMREWKI